MADPIHLLPSSPPPSSSPSHQWSRDTNRSSIGIETFTNHLEGGRGNVRTCCHPSWEFIAAAKKNSETRFDSFLFVAPVLSLPLSRFLFSPFSLGPLYPLWKSVNETEHTVLVESLPIVLPDSEYFNWKTFQLSWLCTPLSLLLPPALRPLLPCFSFPGGNQGFIFRDIRYVQTICATSPADS